MDEWDMPLEETGEFDVPSEEGHPRPMQAGRIGSTGGSFRSPP